jgi:hypothetical protein
MYSLVHACSDARTTHAQLIASGTDHEVMNGAKQKNGTELLCLVSSKVAPKLLQS